MRSKISLGTLSIFSVVLLLILASVLSQKYSIELEQEEIGRELQGILSSSQGAVRHWARNQETMVSTWAKGSEVQRWTEELLRTAQSKEELLNQPAQTALRTWFAPVIASGNYQGFFIIAPDNTNLASMRDSNTGVESLLTEQPWFLREVRSGIPLVSHPQVSDVPLPDKDGILREGRLTAFVGAPIRNDAGKIIAVLTLRTNPENDLNAILKWGRSGSTGKTYAFDATGRLISESRFDQHLRDAGLIEPTQQGVLNLILHEPGTNLVEGQKTDTPLKEQMLTRMAQSALSGKSGMDLEGYRDYRGVPVFGAWTWDTELGFGIATEINIAEAYTHVRATRLVIIGFTAFTILTLILGRILSQSNQRRKRSEQYFRGVFEQSPLGIALLDSRMDQPLQVNQKFCEIIGYTQEEMLTLDFQSLTYPEDWRDHLDHMGKLSEEQIRSFNVERRYSREDGSFSWVNLTVVPIRIEGQEKLFHLAMAEDITNRKRAEQNLYESERTTRLLLNSTAEAIYGLDLDGNCTFCNPACLRLLGYDDVSELIGQNMHALIHHKRPDESAYPADECPISRTFNTGKKAHIDDEVFWRNDGRPFPAAYWTHPVLRDGILQGAVVTFFDITQRVQAKAEKALLEQELHQAHKMEVIGQLAGGVAHDFNNLLLVIAAHVDKVRNQVEVDSGIAKSMKSVESAVDQATGVTRSLLTFSQKISTEKSPIDLCATVEEAAHMLRGILPPAVELIVDTGSEPGAWINADPTQIHRIIINLAVNARDAMPEGGTLGVSVISPPTPPSEETTPETERRFAQIVVLDTGIGMSLETQARIFEPFYTTKERGQGTGLGLSMIRGIAHDHEGEIEVESKPGKGSTFTIYFPCVPPDQKAKAKHAQPHTPLGHGESILLAEDNPQVREIMAATISSLGFRAVQVTDGYAILETFKNHGEDFKLFIVDVDLPKMSGSEALNTMRIAGAETPAILITGSTDPGLEDKLDQHTLLLRKPISMDTLRGMITEQVSLDAESET